MSHLFANYMQNLECEIIFKKSADNYTPLQKKPAKQQQQQQQQGNIVVDNL